MITLVTRGEPGPDQDLEQPGRSVLPQHRGDLLPERVPLRLASLVAFPRRRGQGGGEHLVVGLLARMEAQILEQRDAARRKSGDYLFGFLADAVGRERHRGAAERITYREAFQRHVGIDPLTADVAALDRASCEWGAPAPADLPRGGV